MRTSGLRRSIAITGALLVASVGLAACGGGKGADKGTAAPAAAEGALSGVCPQTVVIQTDWEPEAEHGGVYALLGDKYTIDKNRKSVSGPLMAAGKPTGVNVEIRIGGPSVGYQAAQSLLYQDRDILFGYGRTTEYMIAEKDTPVTAVLATMEKSPYAIYWDPQTYPAAKKISDLKATGATVSVGPEENMWVDYLVGSGQLDAKQIDRSDQNKPGMFVAAKGKLAEAGFITAEPFMYQYEIADWGKPVVGELVADAGYPEYFQALTVRTDDIKAKGDCLKKLVPILQQAQIDYIKNPTATNALIVKLVGEYNTGWVYSAAGAEYAHKTAVADGIFANGADGVMGSFDKNRVQTLIDIVGKYSTTDLSGVTPDTLVTNEFLDTSIKMGG
ncbi:ABC transporter substrate-binding protein [Mycolicibacterium sp. CBM1]